MGWNHERRGERSMNERSQPGIFLSHTHADKSFARRLAVDLKMAGAQVWIDEAEIQVGDSLIEKIREGIDAMDYLGVVLSPDSVNSSWVRREVDIAMNQEIEGKRVRVLPLLYKNCDLPGFLKGKLYADFTRLENYETALKSVLRRLGLNPREDLTAPHFEIPYQKYSAVRQSSSRRYDPHGILDIRQIENLSIDAKKLLFESAEDDSQLIQTDWDEKGAVPRLFRLSTNSQEIKADSQYDSGRWESALKILQENGLIQHVASRKGYRAYRLTPNGWVLAEYSKRQH
jgi:hypothetical protein